MFLIANNFTVAYKRLIDNVPMAVDYEMVYGLDRVMYKALTSTLKVTGVYGGNVCSEFLKEPDRVHAWRSDLKRKLVRLEMAREELADVGL